MATNATTLYWKLEDVPVGDGEAPHPEDVGPAWRTRSASPLRAGTSFS
jgi:hypothetical protein